MKEKTCEHCGTVMADAGPIGLYCPNRDCRGFWGPALAWLEPRAEIRTPGKLRCHLCGKEYRSVDCDYYGEGWFATCDCKDGLPV